MTSDASVDRVTIDAAGSGQINVVGHGSGHTFIHRDPSPGSRPNEPVAVAPDLGRRVFIAHGRDLERRSMAAELVRALGLTAVVFDEEPDGGRTVIEKLEALSDVAFAVVLLTADDVGGLGTAAPARQLPRARQNVVLELGYFVAKLGRGRVCVLHEPSVEIPSDYLGVLFTVLDADGRWRHRLAREMKAAGLPIDLAAVPR
jgi:predicted nucleotide-binding protein